MMAQNLEIGRSTADFEVGSSTYLWNGNDWVKWRAWLLSRTSVSHGSKWQRIEIVWVGQMEDRNRESIY